ncbi:MAG: hypothetical protein K9L61_06035, partial [Candidatus Omnitrophica bacterium]|nr:hypothetical protein [Candidatus Omnitrophota bacterium]
DKIRNGIGRFLLFGERGKRIRILDKILLFGHDIDVSMDIPAEVENNLFHNNLRGVLSTGLNISFVNVTLPYSIMFLLVLIPLGLISVAKISSLISRFFTKKRSFTNVDSEGKYSNVSKTKLAIIGKLFGKIVVPEHLEGEDRIVFLRNKLSHTGLTNDEIEVIVNNYRKNKVNLAEEAVDPKSRPKVPAIGKSNWQEKLESAKRTFYPDAVVISSLLNSGLVEVKDVEVAIIAGEKRGKIGAELWDELTTVLKNKAQDRAFKQIVENKWDDLKRLPVSPEVAVLKLLAEENMLGQNRISELAKKYQGNNRPGELFSFVREIVRSQLREVFDDFLNRTIGDQIIDDSGFNKVLAIRDNLFQGVFAIIRPYIFSNPGLLRELKENKDINYNPYAMNKATEPQTLLELIGSKLFVLNPSATNDHSFGMMVLYPTLIIYFVRDIISKINDSNNPWSPAQVQKQAHDFLITWKMIFWSETWRHDAITQKKISFAQKRGKRPQRELLIDVLTDESAYDLFQYLINKNKTLEETLLETKSGRKLVQFLLENKTIAFKSREVISMNDYSKSARDESEAEKQFDFYREPKTAQELKRAIDSQGIDLYDLLARRFEQIEPEWNKLCGIPAPFNPTKDKNIYHEVTVVGRKLKQVMIELLENEGHETSDPMKLDKATKNRFGLGMITLYKRIIVPPLLRMHNFWGVNKKIAPLVQIGRIGLIALAFYFAPWLWLKVALSVWVFSSIPVLFGKASSFGERMFWLGIITTATFFHFGLLVHLVFGSLVTINFASFGFVYSSILMLVTAIPTYISVYHLFNTFRSFAVLVNEQFMGKFLVGWRSLVPWRVWAGIYEKWYNQAVKYSQERMPLMSNGLTVQQYFQHLLAVMLQKWYISEEEYDLWSKRINGEEGGKFVKPKNKTGEWILYNAFFSLSQKKPLPDVLALRFGFSSNIVASSELYANTFMGITEEGSFNEGKNGEKTNVLGYTARGYRHGWNNLLDFARRELIKRKNSSEEAIDVVIEKLRGVNEYSNIREIVYGDNRLSDADKFVLADYMAKWMNEVRPADISGTESKSDDYQNQHLEVAYALGDMEYHDAIRRMIIEDVRTHLKEKYENEKQSRAPPKSEAKDSEAFVQGYKNIQNIVDDYYRPLLPQATIAGAHTGISLGGILPETIGYLKDLIETIEALKNKNVEGFNEYLLGLIKQFSPKEKEHLADWAKRIRSRQDVIDLIQSRIFNLSQKENIPDDIKKTISSLEKNWHTFLHNTTMVVMFDEIGIYYNINQITDVLFKIFKNQAIALNMWKYYSLTSNYDAHVRLYPGQQVWRSNWVSLQGRNPDIAVVNPMMRIWASAEKAYAGTNLYSIAQETWTSEVQRGRRGSLTFYGKGLGRPETIINVYCPPGEDSAAFLMQQAKNHKWRATQIDWLTFEWGRPNLLAESLVGTEMRYAFNCTRFIMDRSNYAVMYNPEVSFDRKLSHIVLWFHYFIAPLVLINLIAVPLLAPFSGFAFLQPALFFILASLILMEAINLGDLIRHWRQEANFWVASGKTLKDIVLALAFYVFLIPHFFKGIWMASNESFSFIPSQKEAKLEMWGRDQRWENVMQFSRWKENVSFPLMPYAGFLGIAAYIVAFITTFEGFAIFSPYFLASLTFMTGMYCYGAFHRKNNEMYGIKLSKLFTMIPYSLRRMSIDFDLFMHNSFGMFSFSDIGARIQRNSKIAKFVLNLVALPVPVASILGLAYMGMPVELAYMLVIAFIVPLVIAFISSGTYMHTKECLLGTGMALVAKRLLKNKENLTNLRKAREQNNPSIIITDQLWNSLPNELRQALEDLDDNNTTKAKATLFNHLDKVNKEEQRRANQSNNSPSARTRPGKQEPTQAEYKNAFSGVSVDSFATVDSNLTSLGIEALDT